MTTPTSSTATSPTPTSPYCSEAAALVHDSAFQYTRINPRLQKALTYFNKCLLSDEVHRLFIDCFKARWVIGKSAFSCLSLDHRLTIKLVSELQRKDFEQAKLLFERSFNMRYAHLFRDSLAMGKPLAVPMPLVALVPQPPVAARPDLKFLPKKDTSLLDPAAADYEPEFDLIHLKSASLNFRSLRVYSYEKINGYSKPLLSIGRDKAISIGQRGIDSAPLEHLLATKMQQASDQQLNFYDLFSNGTPESQGISNRLQHALTHNLLDSDLYYLNPTLLIHALRRDSYLCSLSARSDCFHGSWTQFIMADATKPNDFDFRINLPKKGVTDPEKVARHLEAAAMSYCQPFIPDYRGPFPDLKATWQADPTQTHYSFNLGRFNLVLYRGPGRHFTQLGESLEIAWTHPSVTTGGALVLKSQAGPLDYILMLLKNRILDIPNPAEITSHAMSRLLWYLVNGWLPLGSHTLLQSLQAWKEESSRIFESELGSSTLSTPSSTSTTALPTSPYVSARSFKTASLIFALRSIYSFFNRKTSDLSTPRDRWLTALINVYSLLPLDPQLAGDEELHTSIREMMHKGLLATSCHSHLNLLRDLCHQYTPRDFGRFLQLMTSSRDLAKRQNEMSHFQTLHLRSETYLLLLYDPLFDARSQPLSISDVDVDAIIKFSKSYRSDKRPLLPEQLHLISSQLLSEDKPRTSSLNGLQLLIKKSCWVELLETLFFNKPSDELWHKLMDALQIQAKSSGSELLALASWIKIKAKTMGVQEHLAWLTQLLYLFNKLDLARTPSEERLQIETDLCLLLSDASEDQLLEYLKNPTVSELPILSQIPIIQALWPDATKATPELFSLLAAHLCDWIDRDYPVLVLRYLATHLQIPEPSLAERGLTEPGFTKPEIEESGLTELGLIDYRLLIQLFQPIILALLSKLGSPRGYESPSPAASLHFGSTDSIEVSISAASQQVAHSKIALSIKKQSQAAQIEPFETSFQETFFSKMSRIKGAGVSSAEADVVDSFCDHSPKQSWEEVWLSLQDLLIELDRQYPSLLNAIAKTLPPAYLPHIHSWFRQLDVTTLGQLATSSEFKEAPWIVRHQLLLSLLHQIDVPMAVGGGRRQQALIEKLEPILWQLLEQASPDLRLEMLAITTSEGFKLLRASMRYSFSLTLFNQESPLDSSPDKQLMSYLLSQLPHIKGDQLEEMIMSKLWHFISSTQQKNLLERFTASPSISQRSLMRLIGRIIRALPLEDSPLWDLALIGDMEATLSLSLEHRELALRRIRKDPAKYFKGTSHNLIHTKKLEVTLLEILEATALKIDIKKSHELVECVSKISPAAICAEQKKRLALVLIGAIEKRAKARAAPLSPLPYSSLFQSAHLFTTPLELWDFIDRVSIKELRESEAALFREELTVFACDKELSFSSGFIHELLSRRQLPFLLSARQALTHLLQSAPEECLSKLFLPMIALLERRLPGRTKKKGGAQRSDALLSGATSSKTTSRETPCFETATSTAMPSKALAPAATSFEISAAKAIGPDEQLLETQYYEAFLFEIYLSLPRAHLDPAFNSIIGLWIKQRSILPSLDSEMLTWITTQLSQQSPSPDWVQGAILHYYSDLLQLATGSGDWNQLTEMHRCLCLNLLSIEMKYSSDGSLRSSWLSIGHGWILQLLEDRSLHIEPWDESKQLLIDSILSLQIYRENELEDASIELLKQLASHKAWYSLRGLSPFALLLPYLDRLIKNRSQSEILSKIEEGFKKPTLASSSWKHEAASQALGLVISEGSSSLSKAACPSTGSSLSFSPRLLPVPKKINRGDIVSNNYFSSLLMVTLFERSEIGLDLLRATKASVIEPLMPYDRPKLAWLSICLKLQMLERLRSLLDEHLQWLQIEEADPLPLAGAQLDSQIIEEIFRMTGVFESIDEPSKPLGNRIKQIRTYLAPRKLIHHAVVMANQLDSEGWKELHPIILKEMRYWQFNQMEDLTQLAIIYGLRNHKKPLLSIGSLWTETFLSNATCHEVSEMPYSTTVEPYLTHFNICDDTFSSHLCQLLNVNKTNHLKASLQKTIILQIYKSHHHARMSLLTKASEREAEMQRHLASLSLCAVIIRHSSGNTRPLGTWLGILVESLSDPAMRKTVQKNLALQDVKSPVRICTINVFCDLASHYYLMAQFPIDPVVDKFIWDNLYSLSTTPWISDDTWICMCHTAIITLKNINATELDPVGAPFRNSQAVLQKMIYLTTLFRIYFNHNKDHMNLAKLATFRHLDLELSTLSGSLLERYGVDIKWPKIDSEELEARLESRLPPRIISLSLPSVRTGAWIEVLNRFLAIKQTSASSLDKEAVPDVTCRFQGELETAIDEIDTLPSTDQDLLKLTCKKALADILGGAPRCSALITLLQASSDEMPLSEADLPARQQLVLNVKQQWIAYITEEIERGLNSSRWGIDLPQAIDYMFGGLSSGNLPHFRQALQLALLPPILRRRLKPILQMLSTRLVVDFQKDDPFFNDKIQLMMAFSQHLLDFSPWIDNKYDTDPEKQAADFMQLVNKIGFSLAMAKATGMSFTITTTPP